jgi:hypothetical protein
VLDLLNLASIVCSIIFFFYYRKEQYEIYKMVEISNVSQDDFSIFVEDIPFFLSSVTKNGITNSDPYKG